MSRRHLKFKKSRRFKRKKQPQPPPSEFECSKDISLEVRAIDKIAPEHDKIVTERYFPKSAGYEPYGVRAGKTAERWQMVVDGMKILYLKMLNEELKRLSVMVDGNWLKKTETTLVLESPVPIGVKQLIMQYSQTIKTC